MEWNYTYMKKQMQKEELSESDTIGDKQEKI